MLEAMRSSFFRNMFLTFFLLMNILLGGFSVVLLGQWSRTQREQKVQEMNSQMELAVRVIDEKFSAADLMASQIASSRWLKYVSAKSDILYSRVDYEKKQEICQTIGNQNDSLRIAKSMAVLLPLRDLAVDKVSFWESERYFKSIGLSDKVMGEILSKTEDHYGSLMLYTDEEMQKDNGSFAVIRQLEYGLSSEKLLFVYIDGKQYNSFLKNNLLEVSSFEIIYEGSRIFSWGVPAKDPEQVYRKQIASNLYNWSYTITLNDSGYRKMDWKIGVLVMVVLSALLLLELIIAWELANFSVRPVRALMKKLGIRKTKETMLDAIEKSYLELNEQKEWMETQGNQYYQIAEAGYLSGLLFGNLEKEAAMEYAKKFHFPFDEEMHAQALLFRYLGSQVRDFEKAMLKLQILCTRDGVSAVFCQEEGVLLLTAKEESSVLRQEEKIRVMLDEMFPDLELEMCSGKVYQGFAGVSESYKEITERQAMAIAGEQMPYYYPLDLEISMIHSMKFGNFAETEKILMQIQDENKCRGVTEKEQERVRELIWEIFRRFMVNEEMGALPADWKVNEYQASKQWESLFEVLGQMRACYEEDGENDKLGKAIVAYVDDHFHSSELSQQDIADIFNISRPMVSKLFKERAKMNFIDYLHKKRTEQAICCFQMGECDVIAVAQKVGYENEVTFKRAFVKYAGITPREYVKRIKKGLISF